MPKPLVRVLVLPQKSQTFRRWKPKPSKVITLSLPYGAAQSPWLESYDVGFFFGGGWGRRSCRRYGATLILLGSKPSKVRSVDVSTQCDICFFFFPLGAMASKKRGERKACDNSDPQSAKRNQSHRRLFVLPSFSARSSFPR